MPHPFILHGWPPNEAQHTQHLMARATAIACEVMNDASEPDVDAADMARYLEAMTTPETIEEFRAQARRKLRLCVEAANRPGESS